MFLRLASSGSQPYTAAAPEGSNVSGFIDTCTDTHIHAYIHILLHTPQTLTLKNTQQTYAITPAYTYTHAHIQTYAHMI